MTIEDPYKEYHRTILLRNVLGRTGACSVGIAVRNMPPRYKLTQNEVYWIAQRNPHTFKAAELFGHRCIGLVHTNIREVTP